MSEPERELLRVEGLCKYFPVTAGLFGKQVGEVRAVDDLSFTLRRGETLGVVGESGCGKTTAGRSILRLLEPTRGRVVFDGVEVTGLPEAELRRYRREMQIVFQDPFGSLNPRMRVRQLVGEAIERHGLARGAALDERVGELLTQVGLPRSWANRYPHEFSGGQRQRIGIARALSLSPRLIVCDEAVSALDVSIQAQVVNLFIDLQKRLNLTYLFIAHDLSVVRHISDRVAVMYLGKLVELAPCEAIFERPAHPYTRALLSAIPVPNPRRKHRRVVLRGDIPSPLHPPAGCHFHTRCPAVVDRCRHEVPGLYSLPGGRQARCFHAEGLEQAEDWYDVLQSRSRAATPERTATRATPPPPPDFAEQPPSANGTRLESLGAPKPFAENQRRLGALASSLAMAGGCFAVAAGQPGPGIFAALAGLIAAIWYRVPRTSKVGARPSVGTLLAWVAAALLAAGATARVTRAVRLPAIARQEAAQLQEALAAYATNTGEAAAGWYEVRWRTAAHFGPGVPRDPWGRPYRIEALPDGSPRVVSLGPDGKPSPDDVSSR